MNKRQIAAALREAVFTPGKRGPLQVIADVGDVDYYIRRAAEFLTLSLTALTEDQCFKYLNNALSLIALAKVTIDSEPLGNNDPSPGTQNPETRPVPGLSKAFSG